MSQTIETRLEKLEDRHAAGGLCESNRTDLWKELARVRERLVSLETKLLIGGGALSILGPLVANWLAKHLGG
jgi:hypothetical protein